MVELANLGKNPGAGSKRKRIGRGTGSGYHKTAGRGHKGQKSRSGGTIPVWFEGGQMPLQRRLPKRGFNNIFRTEYEILNVHQLNCFQDGDIVDLAALQANGLVRKSSSLVKVLGNGLLSRKITVKVHKFSATARDKIVQAGGQAEEISLA
ncbi:MAG: 50S ribosomal protein L15 [Deltaproteobacteria bacterium]|nr:50S ribosomal protein L15 [Candidatus Anaeroferrophillus wilburensis]MBN2889539.1 50S ribosomal protein L15 [Deltaproteobacteria bacterium]